MSERPTEHLTQRGGERIAPRRPAPSHRADVRPRYGRIAALGVAVATTVVALAAGVGLVPSASGHGPAKTASHSSGDPGAQAGLAANDTDPSSPSTSSGSSGTSGTQSTPSTETPTGPPAVPVDSGTGRRVVFSQGQQRVWIINGRHHGVDDVAETYLVSGSVTHNLHPGTYAVYSRSMHAIGVDDSGTMTHFVRFTHGPTGAAIGFHDIPVKDGAKIQTTAQLGTPESHGCIRQKESDAVKMWAFAQLGTKVVVTA